MKLVVIESPYAGKDELEVHTNIGYARDCMKDSLRKGEAPFASHLLYTQQGILNDNVPAQRAHGIDAGLAWGAKADLVAVYTDLGISPGMQQGIDRAKKNGIKVVYRNLI